MPYWVLAVGYLSAVAFMIGFIFCAAENRDLEEYQNMLWRNEDWEEANRNKRK